MMDLPYIYRWNRHGRAGQACAVTARSGGGSMSAPALAFGDPKPKRFNTTRVEFADGFVMITSGNAIRKARP